eukprot:CAMPEP_0182510070 /NCGR_PEP_ID=MMETSP1321-20130603/27966_1 /TAXON_ID=91990 /ORGANISM="Bolidomonas sp., Strain RCC1657" /LENGTH=70 /DNA_ID=CAMNT_0024716473 /DNA_START=21 /DNA_END=229 /DNA_ORIENTATION=-
MGASASAINKDEIIARELEKPADGSDLTEETALDEVRRLRALLATYTSPIVLPTPSSKTNGGGGGGGGGG